MKSLLLSVSVLFFISAFSFAQKETLSPAMSAKGTIDGVNVEVHYSAPSVRDREIWGGLVPYNKVWRTGANEATTISFDKDVVIEGQKLAAGKYALFTIPGEDEWVVIFNNEAKQWGAYKYNEDNDALRIETSPQEHDKMQEQMEIVIEDGKVMLHWENLEVHFDVDAA